MDLVDGHRFGERISLRSCRHPRRVAPGVGRRLGNNRSGARWNFGREGKRVGLQRQALVGGDDLVLVAGTWLCPRDEQLPYARAAQGPHRVHPAVPKVPVPHHSHRPGVRRPDGERGPLDTLVATRVRPQHLPQAPVTALIEQVQVEVAKRRPQPVGVVEHKAGRTRRTVYDFELVARRAPGELSFPEPARVDLAHGGPLQHRPLRAGPGHQQVHLGSGRPKCPHKPAVPAEYGVGVVEAAAEQQLHLVLAQARFFPLTFLMVPALGVSCPGHRARASHIGGCHGFGHTLQ